MATPTATSTDSFVAPEVNSGTTTSWLPVTSRYPSIEGCDSAYFSFPGQPFPVAWDPGYGYWAHGDLRCLPPPATTWWEQDHQNPDGFTRLSIRPIECPEAFTTAASSIKDSSTQVLCCPSGYKLKDGVPGRATGNCFSTLTVGAVLTYLGVSVTSTTTIENATSIRAIQFVGWNVADATNSPSASASSNSTSPQSSGLSPGAKAGIGVGAALGAIGLLALAAAGFLWGRRRPKYEYGHAAPPYYHGDAKYAPQPPQPQPMHEMDSSSTRPAELS